MDLTWIPREQNEPSDDLSKGRYDKFDLANRVAVEFENRDFLILHGRCLRQRRRWTIEIVEKTTSKPASSRTPPDQRLRRHTSKRDVVKSHEDDAKHRPKCDYERSRARVWPTHHSPETGNRWMRGAGHTSKRGVVKSQIIYIYTHTHTPSSFCCCIACILC